MKVGILTLHYGFNEGAVLQAKALSELATHLVPESRAEVVDHRYPGKQAVYGRADDPRKQAILNAVNHWLPLSYPPFRSVEADPTLDFCTRTYKTLIVGSDVVWALRYRGMLRRWFGNSLFPRQNDPFFPAFPNVYWPPHSVNVRRVAYAACCGNLCWEEVPKKHRLEMGRRLDGFAAIGVRDERTRALVSALSPDVGRRATVVPDPTIALNLLDRHDGSGAFAKLVKCGFSEDRRSALVVMKDGELSRAAAAHLKSRGFQVVASDQCGGVADIDMRETGLSPLEWGWAPRLFEICVTERMHMTIFCILNSTRLLALDMNVRRKGTQTKLEELLSGLGMEGAYRHQDTIEPASVPQLIDESLQVHPDWSAIQKTLYDQRQRGQLFLLRALAA